MRGRRGGKARWSAVQTCRGSEKTAGPASLSWRITHREKKGGKTRGEMD